MTRRASHLLSSVFAALAASGLSLACVSAAHNDVAEARARYERCVSDASAAECRAEKERMLAAERTYQESAQRAWGCDPDQQECPPKR